jgi:carbon storage regulator
MLVLSRKAGEAIVLGGNIRIYVLSIEHDRIKLGVDAPPDVLVLRSELIPEQGGQQAPDSVPAVPHAVTLRQPGNRKSNA